MATKSQWEADDDSVAELNNDMGETFTIDGVVYHADPTLEEFIKESPVTNSLVNRVMNAFSREGITEPSVIASMTKEELGSIAGISENIAKILYDFADFVARRGRIVLNYGDVKDQESVYRYLSTGSTSLDMMLVYDNGEMGWRSKTMIELYGEPAAGKTQICLTAAIMAMRSKDDGGWGRGVGYIDTEGAFNTARFDSLARYWGVDQDTLESKFLFSRAHDFDDVDRALDRILIKIEEYDIGIIIVDSVMAALKSQYTIGGHELNNLTLRQRHLGQVLEKLKRIGEQHNLITIYTNHVMANINGKGQDLIPYGGSVMGHASDIRIRLRKASKTQLSDLKLPEDAFSVTKYNMGLSIAEIADSGFLPKLKGMYVIGHFGIADPMQYKMLIKQTKDKNEKGYATRNARNNTIEPTKDAIDKKRKLEEITAMLYGEIPKHKE